MITITPIKKALVPVDSNAAHEVSAPNYDEFQGNKEIYDIIKAHPSSILTVTMGHCDVASESDIMIEGSEEALDHSSINYDKLKKSNYIKEAQDIISIYEIENDKNPDTRLIGLICMSKTGEIRTAENPGGSIIRNEGIREYKAKNRADLTKKIDAFIGMVNNCVEDKTGKIGEALEKYADQRECDYKATDVQGRTHKIWNISDQNIIDEFTTLFKEEPHAMVADGNHRSAAAAMLGYQDFLNVIFPVHRMSLAPYNRLVKNVGMSKDEILKGLEEDFAVTPLTDEVYEPNQVHDMGFYIDGTWYKIVPKEGVFDPADAVQDIDSNIVQEKIFSKLMEISDNKDPKLNFVGGNKDGAYLKSRVDNGEYQFAMTLAPVTIQQFINVCLQGKYMPPKSTWFDPKVRSGMVIAEN